MTTPDSSSWPLVRLSDCADILSGGTPFKGEAGFWGGSIPWVSAKDMKIFRLHDARDHVTPEGADNGTRIAPAGSTLVLVRGMTLHDHVPVCWLMCNMAFNQDVKAVVPKSHVHPEYLAYWLAASGARLHGLVDAAGHGTGRIAGPSLHALPVRLPPLEEQRLIARSLGAVDRKIELNRRMNGTLESIARAVFKSWFVDFDPVRKKLEGGEVGLPSDLAAIFPSSLGESPLGQIPAGWAVDAVGELIDLRYGRALRAQDRQPGYVPVYGSNGQVGWHDTPLVFGPGIVVGRKGNPGTVSWVQGDFFPIDTSFYVRPKRDTADLHYLYHALDRLGLPSLSADSAVPGLNRESACHARLLKPPLALTTAYGSFVKPLAERQAQFERESVRLTEARDALLPKLLNGTLHHTHQSRGVRCD